MKSVLRRDLWSCAFFGNPTRERGTINLDSVPRLRFLKLRFLVWCLVVGRTEDAMRAGTAQTPPLCRRDYAINDVSTCVRSSGNCSVCSVRPTPRSLIPKRVSDGVPLSLAHASGYQKEVLNTSLVVAAILTADPIRHCLLFS